jgi:hypothetical protein
MEGAKYVGRSAFSKYAQSKLVTLATVNVQTRKNLRVTSVNMATVR